MEFIVAQTAGFCFGVAKAVQLVEEQMDSNSQVSTYGPIIHNPQVVAHLESRGVQAIKNLEGLKHLTPSKDNHKVVIRSHGVSESVYTAIADSGCTVVDGTCPYVKRIHRLVQGHDQAGRPLILIGQPDHPEVQGIKGWTKQPVYIIETPGDVEQLDVSQTYGLVTQTTFNISVYKDIIEKLQSMQFRVMIDETICQATALRQKEAIDIAKKVTKMLVIGGKSSSNTIKLVQICKGQCEATYHIETIDDLELIVFSASDIIGITAGASTPKNIIEEVILNVGRTNL